MKYRLVSLGRLKPGVSEDTALPMLMKITKLEELPARKKLLAGKKLSLLTSADVNRVAAAKGRFEKIGLMVEVVEVPDAPTTESTTPEPTKKTSGSTWFKRVGIAFASLLIVIVGALAGLWYWLFLADAPSEQLEQALVTETTAAIVNVDLAQAAKLETLLRLDLNGLLDSSDEASLLTDILLSRKAPNISLDQAYTVVFAQGEEQPVDWVTAVAGTFPSTTWQPIFSKYHQISPLESGVIELSEKPIVADFQCPGENEQPVQPTYAMVGDGLLLMSNSEQALTEVSARVNAQPATNAALSQWQAFRERKLVSAMVFSPESSARALPGFVGFIGAQMAQSVPQVTSLALSAEVDFQNQGVVFDASLFSNDANWNNDITAQANRWLTETKSNSNITSDVMARLLDQLTVSQSTQAVSASWPIGRTDVENLKDSVENTLASMFGGTMSFSNQGDEEVLETNPVVYNRPIDLNALPPMDESRLFGEPLLIDGPYAYDVSSVEMNDNGFLTLMLSAKAALPELADTSGLSSLFQFALTINDVVDRQGESMMRDERCVDPYDVFGSLNHLPEDNGSAFSGQASVNRRIRLEQGVNISDINQVFGQYQLSYPKQVQSFSIPLKAGEKVEHAGAVFEVISLGERNVRYKLTGNVERFMELRALNANGDVLRKNFSSSTGKIRDQKFQGVVSRLQVYIADGFDTVSHDFTLSNLFEPTGEEEPAHPFVMSYATVQRAKWNKYQFVDMRLVKPTPDDWFPNFDSGQRPVGNQAWPGAKLFVTHNADGFNANPYGHLALPLWVELFASMSSLSYRLSGNDQPEQFVPAYFPYRGSEATLELVENQRVRNEPFGLVNFMFNADYEDGEAFKGLSGVLTLRLPQGLQSTDENFNQLWKPMDINGVTVELERVTRGTFAGYNFRVTGDLDDLIAVHGMTDWGKRVAPSFQSFNNGSWSVILPFHEELNTLRIITATEQDEFELAFDFQP